MTESDGKTAAELEKGVSIVLPTYNEAGNIVELVRHVQRAIPPGWASQVLVVDDNSPDGTYRSVKETFEGDASVEPILRTTDRGFAKSIRTGIEHARFERVVVMDSDFTHDPAEIPRLLHVGDVYDVVTGSRFCAGGRMMSTGHYLTSMTYNWMLRILLRTQIQDNLGGYFTARKSMILALPADEIFFGYGDYYFRFLHFAQRCGYSIVELPAQYLARGAGKSKSSWLRMIRTYTLAAIRLRIRIWQLRRSGVVPPRATGSSRQDPGTPRT